MQAVFVMLTLLVPPESRIPLSSTHTPTLVQVIPDLDEFGVYVGNVYPVGNVVHARQGFGWLPGSVYLQVRGSFNIPRWWVSVQRGLTMEEWQEEGLELKLDSRQANEEFRVRCYTWTLTGRRVVETRVIFDLKPK